jgi:hypothetical protein
VASCVLTPIFVSAPIAVAAPRAWLLALFLAGLAGSAVLPVIAICRTDPARYRGRLLLEGLLALQVALWFIVGGWLAVLSHWPGGGRY